MRLLLISNSTNAGESFLQYADEQIKNFLGEKSLSCLFIPYAAVSFSFGDFEKKVQKKFTGLGYKLQSIHTFPDPVQAVQEAEVIVVGGGNTWQLIKMMQDNKLMAPIREKVLQGVPYIGWSAGSNVACPAIHTTNDMPIVQPDDFSALQLIPFQINPHYLDANPEGHSGETRETRINEFLEVNRQTRVVGLREGTMLQIESDQITLLGTRPARIFLYGKTPFEVSPLSDLNFLLK